MLGAAAGAAALVTVVAIGAFTVTVVAVDSAYPRTSISAPDSTGGESAPSPDAVADIPPDKLALYREAASDCPGLDWTILAGIGKVETDHGRSHLPGVSEGENSAGAGGPMQFLASTFDSVTARHRLPAGGASPPSRYNASDAIHAAAFYLCDSGADRGDVRAAIFAYNHADWYVDQVLDQANRYRATTPPPPRQSGSGDCEHLPGTDQTAATVLAFACAQLGQPYVWGGNGPQASGGWDCSGLTKAAYAAAGIALPRTTTEQYHATTPVSAEDIRPGDLVFYANEKDGIHHVGLYLGNNQMIDAPDFGQRVKIENYRYQGDDFLSATRVSPRTENNSRGT